MTQGRDYIPHSDNELVPFAKKFAAYAMAEFGGGRFIAPGVASELSIRVNAFETLVVAARSGDHLVIQQKNEAKDVVVNMIRDIVKHDLANREVTNDDRTAFGLPLRDDTRTPIPVPTGIPFIKFEQSPHRIITFSYKDADTTKGGKPYGTNGVVCAYALLDEPPASVDQLTHTVLATRSPHSIDFAETDRGKRFYIAACWQNNKGQRGPWSDIVSEIVP